MTVGRSDTMVVTSIMNTGGTVGGIIGIPIVAYLSGHGHWHAAFFIGAALALISMSAWFAIDLGAASADPPILAHRSRVSGGYCRLMNGSVLTTALLVVDAVRRAYYRP